MGFEKIDHLLFFFEHIFFDIERNDSSEFHYLKT